MLKTILSVIFVLICVALSVIVLLQEGKSAGLGSIGGMAETYWGKNKGRSMEGPSHIIGSRFRSFEYRPDGI